MGLFNKYAHGICEQPCEGLGVIGEDPLRRRIESPPLTTLVRVLDRQVNMRIRTTVAADHALQLVPHVCKCGLESQSIAAARVV